MLMFAFPENKPRLYIVSSPEAKSASCTLFKVIHPENFRLIM